MDPCWLCGSLPANPDPQQPGRFICRACHGRNPQAHTADVRAAEALAAFLQLDPSWTRGARFTVCQQTALNLRIRAWRDTPDMIRSTGRTDRHLIKTRKPFAWLTPGLRNRAAAHLAELANVHHEHPTP